MSHSVISVKNLGKRYVLGDPLAHNTLRDQIAHVAGAIMSRIRGVKQAKREMSEFWALNDVSFEVNEGEALGIIGHNGAGKSTLLKILSQITEPTTGEIRIRGRVSSLLEVGTGFHPELSGRENIYMNGAILGMSRREITSKFDEIVSFAEVGPFVDTPVKRYSSGMHVRLAFAVAAHLEPEILLVDEVLAVGDASFQRKCLSKMGDAARGGRTVLFVSHSMAAMQTLCDRVIWMERGKIKKDGEATSVIKEYLHSLSTSASEKTWTLSDAPGSDFVKIRRASIRPATGTPGDPITVSSPAVVEFEYWNLTPGAKLHITTHLLDEHGTVVFCSNTVRETAWHGKEFPHGLFKSACEIPGHLLNDGTYRIRLLIVRDGSSVLSHHDDMLVFDVIDDDQSNRAGWFGKWPGLVRPRLEWQTELLDASEPAQPAQKES